mmetsp:Transcript_72012/g.131417  ORF Transcript_72012/g.131417 Transcript_72012/m.131417 type:complete len:249 (-) Transcript_72012:484-1230(-)
MVMDTCAVRRCTALRTSLALVVTMRSGPMSTEFSVPSMLENSLTLTRHSSRDWWTMNLTTAVIVQTRNCMKCLRSCWQCPRESSMSRRQVHAKAARPKHLWRNFVKQIVWSKLKFLQRLKREVPGHWMTRPQKKLRTSRRRRSWPTQRLGKALPALLPMWCMRKLQRQRRRLLQKARANTSAWTTQASCAARAPARSASATSASWALPPSSAGGISRIPKRRTRSLALPRSAGSVGVLQTNTRISGLG